ncbi:MAG: MoaD/ThiS family protein [Anaerolineaceae bacterium]|nr:MoaD/ThiS family protein [Anaerolineaceae bacterium]
MAITIKLRKKIFTVEKSTSVKKTLKMIGLNPESYLVIRDGELITEDELLKPGDEIKLVSVISGGSI